MKRAKNFKQGISLRILQRAPFHAPSVHQAGRLTDLTGPHSFAEQEPA